MDEAALELVRNWLTRTSHDSGAARALAALDEPLFDTAICDLVMKQLSYEEHP